MTSNYPQDFIKRKEDEIRYLSTFLSNPFLSKNQMDNWNYSLYIEDKFRLLKTLRSEVILESQFSITNRRQSSQSIKNNFFQYLYQRQGVKSETLKVYPKEIVPKYDFEFFTSSGQSALISSLHFLKKIDGLSLLNSSNNPIYFESKDAINLVQIPISDLGDCLFYDGSRDFNISILENHLKLIKYFLLDTTLFDYQSVELKQILDLIHQYEIPTLLVRSHLKLDSFGSEYSLLGSVVGIHTDKFPKHNKDTNQIKMGKCISTTGSFATLDQIYPFLSKAEFFELTSNRTNQIRKICSQLSVEIEKIISKNNLSFKLVCPWHQLYFYVAYKAPQELNLSQDFEKLTKLYQIPAFACDSFCFDYLSYTNTSIQTNLPEHFMFRFTAPDIPNVTSDYVSFFENLLLAVNTKISSL